MKSLKEIENLILRLMEGEDISREETLALKEWLIQNPGKGEEFFELSQIWSQLDTYREVDDNTLEQKWKETGVNALKHPLARRKSLVMFGLKYAAIFILGAVVASGLLFIRKNRVEENLSSQVIEVPLGAKSTVKLSDGSEVILNAGSTLSYDTRFGIDSRIVSLSGEAYFKVAKDAQKPFTVKTPDITVRAYGTTFNIKSYADENTTEATLVEGSISVQLSNQPSRKKKELFLKPNEQLIINKSTRHPQHTNPLPDSSSQTNIPPSLIPQKNKLILSKNIEPDLYTSWIEDKINVKSASLQELAIKLERKYNVKIHIEEKELRSLKFTGILENETIEQVMHVLELSSPVNFRIEEREIWLYLKNNH